MAEPKSNELMEKIVSLCKRKGFVFQSSEIYGGINGFWDYGPLGAELKRNVKELWWNTMTRFRDDVVGLEATIIMHPQIWKASGHVDTFADMMRECPLTHKRARADQVEPQSGKSITYLCAADSKGLNCMLRDLRVFQDSDPDSVSDWLHLAKLLMDDFPDLYSVHDGVVEQPVKQPANFAKRLRIVLDKYRKINDITFGSKETVVTEQIVILQTKDTHRDSIQKIARQFYQERGIEHQIRFIGQDSQVENSTDFHPDSGIKMSEARPFNLMLQTWVGPIQSDENVAYLRPETAQAIFAQFKNVLDSSRQMPPFGIGQIGKAFRNEVTPRNFTFRSREFEQMELEFFIKPDEAVEAISGSVVKVSETEHPGEPQPNWGWQAWHQYWVEERVRFYEGIGLSRDTLGFHRQTKEELAHYARACVDILFKFPFSKVDEHGKVTGDELEGIAARSDFDLSQHQRFSGRPMGVFDEELRAAWGKLDETKKKELQQRYFENRKNYLTKSAKPDETPEQIEKQAKEDAEGLAKGQYIPHVIEPSAGVDRLILALISNAYHEEQVTDEKGKSETRVVMKFHPRVAPIKVGVFPLLKNKPELVKKAQAVRDLLRPHMTVFYDEAGAIGRRYRRQDEAGTPFGVTIDFDTLGEKPELLDTVTLRERDSMQQSRVKISDLLAMLLEKIR